MKPVLNIFLLIALLLTSCSTPEHIDAAKEDPLYHRGVYTGHATASPSTEREEFITPSQSSNQPVGTQLRLDQGEAKVYAPYYLGIAGVALLSNPDFYKNGKNERLPASLPSIAPDELIITCRHKPSKGETKFTPCKDVKIELTPLHTDKGVPVEVKDGFSKIRVKKNEVYRVKLTSPSKYRISSGTTATGGARLGLEIQPKNN